MIAGKPNKAPPTSAEENPAESILVCLIGLSPAVLTETVYALAEEDAPVLPDRILAITTDRGGAVLRRRLFEEGGWSSTLDALRQRHGHHAIDNRLRFGPVEDCIRVFPSSRRDCALSDIRTQADNDAVAEFLLENLRTFTETPGKRLIVSIAGGRKTMGALLLSVMMLIGRAGDRMTHVLVSDPWDRLPDFLFPGCPGSFTHPETGEALDSRNAEIDLAEISFIPLRYLFGGTLRESGGSYLGLMRQLRSRALAPESTLHLEFQTRGGTLRAAGKSVDLSAREFALLLRFALWAEAGSSPVGALTDLPETTLTDLARDYRRGDDHTHWSHRVTAKDDEDDYRKLFSSIRGKLRKAGLDEAAIERIVPRRGRLSIDLSPENIHIN